MFREKISMDTTHSDYDVELVELANGDGSINIDTCVLSGPPSSHSST